MLAYKLGQLADLKSHSHLLDIGPGRGAQLALWKKKFQIEKITALEPNQSSWQRLKAHEDRVTVVIRTKLEDFPARDAVQCVVAVDSCYHISYDIIWNKLLQIPGLKSVVLSDLFLLQRPSSFSDRVFLRIVALAANIPFRNFRTKDEYLRTSGMTLVSWEDTSTQVLDGFCNFVSREIRKRSFFQRLFNGALLKVYCTYLILRRLRARGLVGYALIVFKPKQ
jgi:hypothetical protein